MTANPILVVKVGTSTLTDSAGKLDRSYLIDLTSQLAAQQNSGWNVILVTSGAIRVGIEALGARPLPHQLQTFSAADARDTRSTMDSDSSPAPSSEAALDTFNTLPYKQAAAAIGQGRLMHTYTEAFAWRNIDCAQVLLTREDIADQRRFDNARNTLLTLLSLGVVPIINENDTVAVDEIKFGDNDNLAALVSVLIRADLLLILSDVEGLYADVTGTNGDNLGEGSAAQAPIRVVERVTAYIQSLAGDTAGELGTGGMRTKIEAARVATEAGIRTVIARGRRPDVVRDVVNSDSIGTVGTSFLPQCAGHTLTSAEGE